VRLSFLHHGFLADAGIEFVLRALDDGRGFLARGRQYLIPLAQNLRGFLELGRQRIFQVGNDLAHNAQIHRPFVGKQRLGAALQFLDQLVHQFKYLHTLTC